MVGRLELGRERLKRNDETRRPDKKTERDDQTRISNEKTEREDRTKRSDKNIENKIGGDREYGVHLMDALAIEKIEGD